MLSNLVNAQYCYEYLVNQISMGLLLYSHLPVAITALLFSLYVLVKARGLPSLTLFCTCFVFTIWCAFDLSAWFSFLGSANTMFVWSSLDFLAVLMFFFGYYFLYTFVTGKDLPLWQKILGIVVMTPTAYIVFYGLNIPMYDLNSCTALEDGSFTIYTYYSEAVIIVAALIFVIFQYQKGTDKAAKSRILLSGIGVLIFFTFFFSASFLVSLLAATDASSYVYNYLIYGLFGMPIFLIYLGYLIVRYHAFDLRVFTAQALSVAIVALVATQYAFLTGISSIVLNSVNLLLVSVVSLYLTRNVKKEIALREDLDVANKKQEGLIHFISHEIKGYLGKSEAAFAGIVEGDYGVIPKEANELAASALADTRKGVATVMDILNASNLKKGTVAYDMKPFDLKATVTATMAEQQKAADAKSLSLVTDIGEDSFTITGDESQIKEHVVRNLIDNAIKYTPSGSVTVSLKKQGSKILFLVRDSGIGITNEDKKKLFTEGGRGAESIKTNVNSTGYGLFIAKQIVDAHKGKIWAESEGAGKGSTFFVELPA